MDYLNKELPVPNSSVFAGHQTFAPRIGWLKKGYDVVIAGGGAAFSGDAVLVTLGVGKNMVTSIRYWLVAFGVVKETAHSGLQVTDLGRYLFDDEGLDPYMEHVATLWVLHTELCSPRSPAFTWVYTFNQWRRQEFFRDKLAETIYRKTRHASRPPSMETVSRDVDCFIHTYVSTGASKFGRQAAEDGLDSPFTGLGIINAQDLSQGYRLAIGPKPHLSPAVFAWALARYWNETREASTTLSATEIMYEPGTPGVLFKLDEESVLAYLDTLNTLPDGVFRFEDTPQSQQVVRCSYPFDTTRLLEACYARR